MREISRRALARGSAEPDGSACRLICERRSFVNLNLNRSIKHHVVVAKEAVAKRVTSASIIAHIGANVSKRVVRVYRRKWNIKILAEKSSRKFRGTSAAFSGRIGYTGFYGVSSMERLPVETAMTEQVRRFRAIKLKQ